MAPDRGHVHHRLIDMGLSQKQAVGVLYVVSAILGLSAVLGESPLKLAEGFWRYAEPVRPNPEHQAVYDRRYQLYKQLRAFYKEI